MAKELSQAEVLDFLCQAGGSVANAALLSHFRHFLRDPDASPAQLQRRRELFKGFVNSVATVKQDEPPGAAKYVVLRKRYRELVGEEPKAPADNAAQSQAAKPPPPPPLEVAVGRGALQGQAGAQRAPRAHGQEPPRRQVEEERAGPGSAHQLRTCPEHRRCHPGGLGGRSGALFPPNPALGGRRSPSEPCALLGTEQHSQREPRQAPRGDPPLLLGGAPQSNGPYLPVGKMGAPPRAASPQQRIREWVERAHAVTHQSALPDPLLQREEGSSWPARPSPPSSVGSACLSQDSLPGLGARRDPAPVFRSIRCQLSLQDLEDFIEKASSASEDGSSASGGSDSYRPEGRAGVLHQPFPARQNGHGGNSTGTARARPESLCYRPHGNGLAKDGAIPEHLALLNRVVSRAASWDKLWDADSPKPGKEPPNPWKVTRLSPSPLETPLSPRLVQRQGCLATSSDVQGLGPDPDAPSEGRSSSVPLEPREHAWLVKVATGSWMQARALFLEDPHLATRKDFIMGYTVLHWLAKHGNVQVMQDFVAGARKAGVDLDVDAKSGCGYTPLHLAAMHGHQLVVKLLVQKLRCSTQVRDSSGKRPWQYLSSATSGEVWQLLEAPQGKTIFPAHPIARSSTSLGPKKGKSPELGRKVSRKTSLAAYLKPQHIKWKMGSRFQQLQEKEEEYND
ncbi:ankyrin repeat domain-containing protein SOWAHB [Podarcis raffonei]|uniref:ankyrin repeat domain-containing protein SOWAHB n=1 Tax=Podarcis raffonei TaxID=65483 RepID=UPI002329430F|nr:ankyrin repeat domain-containing protein SOWAHB [Podarcis raffonei]